MMSDLRHPRDFGLGTPRFEHGQAALDADATYDTEEAFTSSRGCDTIAPYRHRHRSQQPQAPATLMNALSSSRIQLQSFLLKRRGINRDQRPQIPPQHSSSFASVLTNRSKQSPSQHAQQPRSQRHHLSIDTAVSPTNAAPDPLSTSEMIRQEVVSAFRVSGSDMSSEFNSMEQRSDTLRNSQSESAVSSLKRRSPVIDESQNTLYLTNAETTAAAAVLAPHKRQKRALHDSLLHHSCKLFSQDPNIIESALQLDPEAVHYTCPMLCLGASSNKASPVVSPTPRLNERPVTFKYALNIALKHNAALKVVELLANAGPDVCMEPDGPLDAGSLSIALETASTATTSQETDEIVRLLLAANSQCAAKVDRHYNTALHYAARFRNVSVTTVSQIQRAHPAALVSRNFHGYTPLQVAQRSGCSEHVLNYLHTLAHCRQDDTLEKGLDSFDSLLQVRCETNEEADEW